VIVDTGANLLTNSLATRARPLPGVTPVSVRSAVHVGYEHLGGSVSEDFFLVRDPEFLVRPYTRDMRVIPLAPTVTSPQTPPVRLMSDTTLAIRAPKYTGRGSRVFASNLTPSRGGPAEMRAPTGTRERETACGFEGKRVALGSARTPGRNYGDVPRSRTQWGSRFCRSPAQVQRR